MGGRVPDRDEAVPDSGDQNLWFGNLGGYDSAQVNELHANLFVVATDAQDARRKTIAGVKHWTSPHKDNILDIDQAINLSAMLADKGVHIHLTDSDEEIPFEFEARYVPFGRMSA